MNYLIGWATFGLNIIILIVSVAGFLKILKNDLSHLQKDVAEIKKNQEHLYDKVVKLCERVSNIEGKLEK